MTNAGRNMKCVYTSDVKEILKFKTFIKVLKRKLHVRRLITNKE
jgi:hypothetical protein